MIKNTHKFSIQFRWIRSIALITILFFGIGVGIGCKPSIDEDALSLELFAQAVSMAKESEQKVLLVFGAEWCGDCTSLKERFNEHPKISSLLRENFLVVHIDVGRFDKNQKFAETFGSPQKKGIPALVIVDPANSGKILASTEGGEFSRASSMDDESIYSYLKQFSSK